MFKIGEFSHIARVSTRSLRYYDQLGLLEPGFVDPGQDHAHARLQPAARAVSHSATAIPARSRRKGREFSTSLTR